MQMFECVVVRINDIEANAGSFSQKEIIVSPVGTDTEVASEYIAIPPSTFPTDEFGSAVVTCPEIGQRCIVTRVSGDRRVSILNYIPYAGTTIYGEYTPVDASSGGAAFKIGGVTPITMYMHKGGKWELFSGEFSRMVLDGSKRQLIWATGSEERLFDGGRVLNTSSEVESIEEVTQHTEVYTTTREWKQNSDIRISGEKSVLNPETSIVPLPTYSYVPKVLIKAGTILNEFDSNLGRMLGHLYQVETRQSTYSGDKDTVTKLKLGRQSEMFKFDNNSVYPAGDLLEWVGKTSKITGELSRVDTYLLRFGQLEKDVVSNGAPSEYVEGEVFRNQINVKIVDPIGAPLVNIVAEGKGYEFEWPKSGAEEQYLVSYGRLNSSSLQGNADFLYKSAVREHFHAYEDHSVATIAAPTGMRRDFVNFFDNNGEKGLYFEKFSKITAGIEEIFQKELLTDQKYEFEQNMPTHSVYEYLDSQKWQKILNIDPERQIQTDFESNLYKNYVKLDGSTEKTEEFNAQHHEMEIKLGSKSFLVHFESDFVKIELKDENNLDKSPFIKMDADGIQLTGCGTESVAGDNIIIGEGTGPQYLVTKSFLDLIFKNHIHPTAGPGAPTLPPVDIPVPQVANSAANTYTFKIKGE